MSTRACFVWDEQNLLEQRSPANGQLLYEFTNVPGTWGGVVSSYGANAGVSTFYSADLVGNNRMATNITGITTLSVDYQAFGTDAYYGTVHQPFFLFGGQYGYHTTSFNNLNVPYIRQRWYDTATGQWLSPDRIGFDGGDWNLRRAVGNNPLTRSDPSGLDAVGDGILGLLETLLQEALNDTGSGGWAGGILTLSQLQALKNCLKATSDLDAIKKAILLLRCDKTYVVCQDICDAFIDLIKDCLSSVQGDDGNSISSQFQNYCYSAFGKYDN